MAQAGAPLQLLLINPQGFEARKVLFFKHFQRIKSRSRRSVFFAFSLDACYTIR